MIGMNQIKKRLIYGILIGLAVGIIGIVITILITNSTIKSYEEGTNETFLKNYTTLVATFKDDVLQGKTITSDMIAMTRVHIKTVPADVATEAGLIGKIAKYNIPKNITVVNSMVSDSILTQDVRTQQVTAVLLPAKLTVGEYVDIRLQVPSGVEYIVLSQKQVLDIVGTTIWLNLSEDELLLLNSAIVDSYMTKGSKLYAVEYADPDTQISTDEEAGEKAKEYLQDKIKDELASLAGGTTVTTTVNDDGETVTDTQLQTSQVPLDELMRMISTYAIEYRYFVEAYNRIDSNYQPNSTVMAAMKANKYVVQQAKERLDAEARTAIEASIDAFENQYGDDYTLIVSGIQDSVSTQQGLRNQVLSEE